MCVAVSGVEGVETTRARTWRAMMCFGSLMDSGTSCCEMIMCRFELCRMPSPRCQCRCRCHRVRRQQGVSEALGLFLRILGRASCSGQYYVFTSQRYVCVQILVNQRARGRSVHIVREADSHSRRVTWEHLLEAKLRRFALSPVCHMSFMQHRLLLEGELVHVYYIRNAPR